MGEETRNVQVRCEKCINREQKNLGWYDEVLLEGVKATDVIQHDTSNNKVDFKRACGGMRE